MCVRTCACASECERSRARVCVCVCVLVIVPRSLAPRAGTGRQSRARLTSQVATTAPGCGRARRQHLRVRPSAVPFGMQAHLGIVVWRCGGVAVQAGPECKAHKSRDPAHDGGAGARGRVEPGRHSMTPQPRRTLNSEPRRVKGSRKAARAVSRHKESPEAAAHIAHLDGFAGRVPGVGAEAHVAGLVDS